jgi:hypothetical protein
MSRGYQSSKKPITLDEHVAFGEALSRLFDVIQDVRINRRDDWRARFRSGSRQAKAVDKAFDAVAVLRQELTKVAVEALKEAGRDGNEAVGIYWPDMAGCRLTSFPVLTNEGFTKP